MKLTKYNITIILIIILGVALIWSIIFPPKTFVSTSYKNFNQNVLDEFWKDDYLEQEFVTDSNYNYIGIPIAIYDTIIKNGKVLVTIQNETGKVKKYTIKASNLVDNQKYYLKYRFKKDKKYILRITTKDLSSPITFTVTHAEIDNAKLIVNNQLNDSNLVLSFIKYKKDYYKTWYILFFISLLSVYAVIIKEDK